MKYSIVINDFHHMFIDARSPKDAAKKYGRLYKVDTVTVKNSTTQFTKTYRILKEELKNPSAFEKLHNITMVTQAMEIQSESS